ncbi:MAG: methylated-DNA--[protein]-cysteine S-methyltransferase, partial [Bacilli bacterium]
MWIRERERTEETLYGSVYDSPLGKLTLVGNHLFLTNVFFETDHTACIPMQDTAVLKMAAKQLDAYFQGTRTHFSVPYALSGTPFQQKVWEAL